MFSTFHPFLPILNMGVFLIIPFFCPSLLVLEHMTDLSYHVQSHISIIRYPAFCSEGAGISLLLASGSDSLLLFLMVLQKFFKHFHSPIPFLFRILFLELFNFFFCRLSWLSDNFNQWFHLPLKMCSNILKHIEKLKSLRILLTASMCMLWRL